MSGFYIDCKIFDHFVDYAMNSIDHYYLPHYYMGSLLYVTQFKGKNLAT